jgi:hypothetical protein
MKEQKIAKFLLDLGFAKNEIIHFINKCRVIPMMGSVMHIKGLSSDFYTFLKEIVYGKNQKNNYEIDGVCFRDYLGKTFDL